MKDIKGYEGLYAVTSCGKVWSYRSQKFLKGNDNGHGYKKVVLYKDGKIKNHYIHRLVSQAYIPNPDNLPEVNHKDEIKSHNYVGNLEWCDFDYNQHYGTRNKRLQDIKEKHPVAQYTLNGDLMATYISLAEAERQTNIHKSSIRYCCIGKRKTAGSYHWRYYDEQ